MNFLARVLLTIFLLTATLFALQTMLVVKAESDKRDEYLTVIEHRQSLIKHRVCKAKWPQSEERYRDCVGL